jgi:uncharacterized protein involved in outer membrane biogenesis
VVHWIKKITFITVLGLLVVGILGVFAAQLYINRPVMTEKIRAVFSQKFGGDLSFKDLRINLLSGLTAEDFRLAAENSGHDPFLSIRQVSLAYSPWALFRKRIKVTNIDLEQPRLNFVHHDDTWLLPQPKSNFIKHALTLSTSHNTFVTLLDNINFNNAAISINSTTANGELFRADGINLSGQLLVQDNQGAAQGTLSIRSMKFGSALTLNNVRSEITYANDEVRFTKLRGDAYDGNAEGAISIPTAKEKENQNYGVYLHFSDIDFPSLVKDFKADPELIHAKINFYCDLWGDISHPSLIQGKGYFESKQVQLTGFKVLDIIGNLLNQPNLRNTKFDTVHGSFKIADDQLTFYSLEIISLSLKISASGTVKYDETIDFDALLTINPALIQQLPVNVTEQFSTQPDGSKSISFKVSGMPGSPVCNLADKLYGKPPEPVPPAQ